MSVHELRDAEEASHVLLQSYLLQRLQPPRAGGLPAVFDLALHLAGAGVPMLPLGVLADLTNLLLQPHGSLLSRDRPPGWSDHLALAYEDYVLGKWLADTSLERAGDALRQYQGADQVRGLAFVVAQLRTRCGIGGLLLSPATLKKLRDQPADQVLASAWDSIEQYGLLPIIPLLYEDLEKQVRRGTAMLGPEDLFELEHRTALVDFSQRVALRQVLQAAAILRESLPQKPPIKATSPREVPSHLRDEDTYPIGGFTSLSNRGSIESLLHSQLAFMEDERPDLFDIKFVRDELLYYSRDENQFFRRCRTFVFAFFPDLVHARVKDPNSAWQQIIHLLALTVATMERLLEWLGEEALHFDFLFVRAENGDDLEEEKSLLELVFREQIANQSARFHTLSEAEMIGHLEKQSCNSVVDCLLLSCHQRELDMDRIHVVSLSLEIGQIGLAFDGSFEDLGSDSGPWTRIHERIIHHWLARC